MAVMGETRCSSSLAEANRWEELWARFLDWEVRAGAFEYWEHGVPLWEYVRVPVFLQLQAACGFMITPQTSLAQKLLSLHTVRDLVDAVTWANPYLAPSRPILCLGIARRIWYQGVWQDPYLDPLLEGLPDIYIYLERLEGGHHLWPVKTRHRYYADLLAAAAASSRRLGRWVLSRVQGWLNRLESELYKSFGVVVAVRALGGAYLAARMSLRWFYERLLRRLRPRLCIIVAVNPAERALVEVCRELGIATAELQHGMIGPYDLTYTTPLGIRQHTFPDYMLTFGPFWRQQMRLPVRKDRAIDVGFPFFQQIIERSEGVIRRPWLLILSQPGCGLALAEWAVRLARAAPPAYRIAFRPHPAEAAHEECYRLLRENGVEVLDSNHRLYDLLASSTIQVGVFSTALYEGLAFGLRTYIAPLPGYQYLRPLLERGWVRLLEDESQPFTDHKPWPMCNPRELFLLQGTQPFHDWLQQFLSRS